MLKVYVIRCQACLLGGVWYTLRNHVETIYTKLRLAIVRNQCCKISHLLHEGKTQQAIERFVRVWDAIDCWDYPEFYWNVLERSHPELWAKLIGGLGR